MNYIGPERRRNIRLNLLLRVSYVVVEIPQEERESFTKDISGGGIRLPLQEKLSTGTLLKLKLELLKEMKTVELDARVVWIKPTPQDKDYPYEAGIEFTNIDLAERNMISNCIQYLDRKALLEEFFQE